jgi:hypothetical protein
MNTQENIAPVFSNKVVLIVLTFLLSIPAVDYYSYFQRYPVQYRTECVFTPFSGDYRTCCYDKIYRSQPFDKSLAKTNSYKYHHVLICFNIVVNNILVHQENKSCFRSKFKWSPSNKYHNDNEDDDILILGSRFLLG